MNTEYIVNVGNMGNIGCDNKEDAVKTYRRYVTASKSGTGRVGAEDVVIMVDGEPSVRFDFYYHGWRIDKQKRVVIRLAKKLEEQKSVLQGMKEEAEQCE
jgi:hypothetical protein